ncbi:MAG: hypothetical protein L3J92_07175 [Thermoplasmata archaeon]|jgi:hypothetical protein|nr:hypothetical protein [Thermoplasmata archaeon]
MSGQIYPSSRRPPPLYRLARALRRASVFVLVVLILFATTVVYSTVEIRQSPPRVGSFSVEFQSNGTIALTSNLTLSNPGFYPIQAFTLDVRVVNGTGVFLGAFGLGPTALEGAASNVYPIALYLPVSDTGPGASLLVDSQYLALSVWGNATFGYLFPAGLSIENSRHWGAPFSNLAYSVGNVTPNGTLPVTIAFQNAASFPDAGTLQLSVLSAAGIVCGGATWTVQVDPGQQFLQTQPVTLSPGCSPLGGKVTGDYVTPSFRVPLPSVAIP